MLEPVAARAPAPERGLPPLEVVRVHEEPGLSRLVVARLPDGALVEMAESVELPRPLRDKWVIIVSTLRGCPVGCAFCDAGAVRFRGRLSAAEILAQVDLLVRWRFPDRRVPSRTFKVQLARMGEPSLNPAVLDVLEQMPRRLDAPGLTPTISSIAPRGREAFFERLLEVRRRIYAPPNFRLQFSLHTTCEETRRRLVPARTWSFREIAAYGERFFVPGGKRVALNFAAPAGVPLDPAALRDTFDPRFFMVKLTPMNPTVAAAERGLASAIDPARPETGERIAERFRAAGYETVLSINDVRENTVGTNCGQTVRSIEAALAAARPAAAEA